MDISLVKTFLEVISAGSFAGAAERLHVTQSAVSIRIQKLEESLSQQLFERSKSGAILTPHGHQFEPHARLFIQVWEEARYNVAVPDGYDAMLSIGCQYSLWPELGLIWLETMEQELTSTSFNVHMGMADRLTRLMTSGIVDIALVYTPELRPGLKAKHIMNDRLVHVSSTPDHKEGLDEDYVYIDWGPEFAIEHGRWYPDFRISRTSLKVGAAAVQYLIRNKKSAYLPYRVADDYIAIGKLHLVPEAPQMFYPAYVVWNTGKEAELISKALSSLKRSVENSSHFEINY